MSDPQQTSDAQQSPGSMPESMNPEFLRLTEELEKARHRVNELAHAVQAGERDREEFKQRQNRERERMIDVEKANVACTLLEAVDQLDLCLHAADQSPLARGVRLIRESILKQAESTGIERVELAGRFFDPNLAEAVLHEPGDGEAVVSEVLRSGYTWKGKVLRPAMVKVRG